MERLLCLKFVRYEEAGSRRRRLVAASSYLERWESFAAAATRSGSNNGSINAGATVDLS